MQARDQLLESNQEQIQTYTYQDRLYDVYKLRVLASGLPTEFIPLEEFVEAIDEPSWTNREGNLIRPRAVLEALHLPKEEWGDYPTLATHITRVLQVNHKTPILVLGEYTIVDGRHRLVKAILEKARKVAVKRFDELPEEALLSRELIEVLQCAPEYLERS